MKKVFLVSVLVVGVGAGCGETFGMDGGGEPVTTTWAVSNTTPTSDDCLIHDPADPLGGTFEITVDGSMVTMEHTTFVGLGGTDDTYEAGDNPVIVQGVTENEDEFPPCRVEFVEGFTLPLDDPEGGFEGNTTIEATWEHIESDISDTTGACEGVWPVDLQCISVLTLTLTQT